MPGTSRHARRLRLAGVTAALGAALTFTGCGFDVQTLQSYTPAHGINLESEGCGASTDSKQCVKVRNLLVIANASGVGRLSASITSPRQADALSLVQGRALNADMTDAGPLTIGSVDVPLPLGKLAVLTSSDVPAITVSGSALKPGLTARLRLVFSSGVALEAVVPVVDASQPIYTTVAPAGAQSPTP